MRQPKYGVCLPCTITSVYDGDTLVVKTVGGGRLRVRLLDCWAPELRHEGGKASRDFARKLVSNSDTHAIFVPFKGNITAMLTFGRVLAYVFLDGQNLSEALVDAGHATIEKQRK